MTISNLIDKKSFQRNEDPKWFESLPEFVGVEYVGYGIDKERLNRATKQWERIEQYRVAGADFNTFLDTRVAYGELYRYRIKTILRFTKKEVSQIRIFNNPEDFQKLISRRLQEAINNNSELFTNADVFTGIEGEMIVPLFGDYKAKFSGDKIEIFKQNTPQVLPSRKKSVISADFSYNGKNFKVTVPIANTTTLIQDVRYKSYYYESYPSKKWTYVDAFETTPPPPPESINIFPNSLNKKIIISWLRPSNSQRDIAEYRLYRRSSVGEKWNLVYNIKELDVNSDGIPDANVLRQNSSNYYEDNDVTFGEKYIYALTCVDIHGIESFLSAQIQAELNANFKLEKEEKLLKWISGSGARLDQVNFIYKKFLKRNEKLIAKKNFAITVNTKFQETNKNFIIRVTSLDTHDKKEYKLTLNNVKK